MYRKLLAALVAVALIGMIGGAVTASEDRPAMVADDISEDDVTVDNDEPISCTGSGDLSPSNDEPFDDGGSGGGGGGGGC